MEPASLTLWLLAAGLSLLIGLTLGLLGGGGSILTVPVLVYLLGLEPKEAIATSLLVVAVTSAVATLQHARKGRVCWKVGLLFSLAGMVGAFLGGRGAEFVPGALLLLLFATIMLATATAMLRRARGCASVEELPEEEMGCPSMGTRQILYTLLYGLLVGGISGLVGAGGGFLIVPALHLLAGLPMKVAVATSLMVIALNSFAALSGYLLHLKIDLLLAGVVTGGAVLGSFFGAALSRLINACYLRKLFGWFVIAMAFLMLYKQGETLAALLSYLAALARCMVHCVQEVPFPEV